MFPAAPKAKDGEVLTFAGGRWQPRTPAASGVPEAPIDGTQYARKDGAWDPVAASVTLATDREVNASEPPASSDSRLRTPFALNYILNPDAEIDTTGWATYADAAGTQPVDGTGGSPSTTWARYNGTSKRGGYNFLLTANAQGEGASYNFTIDSADKNRSLTVSGFAYIGGSTASDVVSLWVYDVTNARLCPISGGNSILATGAFALQFAASDSTSYRLIVHVHKASPGGATVQLDDFYVGPAYLPSAPAMSDWQDGGAITITATTTNPTKGTIVRDKVFHKRIGDSGHFRFEYEHSAAGSAGSGYYLFSLPSGMSFGAGVEFHTSAFAGGVPTARLLRGGHNIISDAPNAYYLSVVPYDATRFRLLVVSTSGAAADFFGSTAFAFSNTVIRFAIDFHAPIAGWSGTTAVQPGSRYLWAQRFAANATRVTTTPSKPGEYRSFVGASDSAATPAPSATDGFKIVGDAVSTNVNEYHIYVGPGKIVALAPYQTTGRAGEVQVGGVWSDNSAYRGCAFHYDPVSGIAKVKAPRGSGAIAGWWLDAAGTALVQYATIYFDLLVADDPVPVALAPAVHVEASSDAGQVVTADTEDIEYEDKAVDTHGAWSGSVFTAPVAGVYYCTFNFAPNTTLNATPKIFKNGTIYRQGPVNVASAGNSAGFSSSIKLAAGDTVRFRSGNGYTANGSATTNWLSITRIGDA